MQLTRGNSRGHMPPPKWNVFAPSLACVIIRAARRESSAQKKTFRKSGFLRQARPDRTDLRRLDSTRLAWVSSLIQRASAQFPARYDMMERAALPPPYSTRSSQLGIDVACVRSFTALRSRLLHHSPSRSATCPGAFTTSSRFPPTRFPPTRMSLRNLSPSTMYFLNVFDSIMTYHNQIRF